MALADTLAEIAHGLAEGAAQLSKNAASDIGSTYQAVLMQDTGWRLQGSIGPATQEIAERIAKEELEVSNDLDIDIGR